MTLLHEAGHAVKSEENREEQQKTRALLLAQNMGVSFANRRLQDQPKANEENLSDTFAFLDKNLAGYDPALIEQAKARFARIFEYVEKTDSKERLRQYVNEQRIRARKINTKYRVKIETDAWIHAVNGLMEFRRIGIELVQWNKEEILHYIESMISTYAIANERFTTEKYSFLPFEHPDLKHDDEAPTTT